MSELKLKSAPEIIRSELYDDEELVWWGQPIASRLARQVNVMSIVMSAVMAIFAIGFFLFFQDIFSGELMYNSPFASSRRSNMPAIFPIMFTLIPGIMFCVSAWNVLLPLRNWVKAQRTYYALTNKRALIIQQSFSTNVQSFYDEHIQKMQVRNYGNDVGDIIFATEMVTRQYRTQNQGGINISFNDDGVNLGTGSRTRTVNFQIQHGFMAISGVRTVEDLVSQIFFEDEQK